MTNVLLQDRLLFPELFWKQPQNIYKRKRGKILVVGGSKNDVASLLKTLNAVFQSKASLVILVTPQGLREHLKDILTPDVTVKWALETPVGSLSLDAYDAVVELAKDVDTTVLGPGLSRNPETTQLIQKLVSQIESQLLLESDSLEKVSPESFSQRTSPTVLALNASQFVALLKKEGFKTPDERSLMEYLYRHANELVAQKAKEWGTIIIFNGPELIITDGNRIIAEPEEETKQKFTEENPAFLGLLATMISQHKTHLLEASANSVYILNQALKKGEPLKTLSEVLAEIEKIV